MPLLIFAAQPMDASIPWWWHDVFVPIAIGVLSATISVLGGLWVAGRTDWYRRLARWEPYSNELWLRQAALYGDICAAARRAMRTAFRMARERRDGEPDRTGPIRDEYQTAVSAMEELEVQACVILSERFNAAFSRFARHLTMVATSHGPESHRYFEDAWELYGDLFVAARASLGIDALDQKALEAIMTGLKSEIGGSERT